MLKKALLPLLLVVAACGASESGATTAQAEAATSTSVEATTTTAPPLPTTTVDATTTSTAGPTTTTALQIDVEFSGGEVMGPDTISVDLGDTVDIWVVSDVDDEMHVHGYDLLFDLEAGVPFHLTFEADVPGIFEVEVHTGHTHLFDLEVVG